MTRLNIITPLVISLITGCAQIPPKAGFDEVEQTLADRLDQQIRWIQNTDEDKAVQQHIQQLLQQALSPQAAVQIALLNNRTLQASYEELGIAQADVVRAGLLKNPVFSFVARFPDQPPSAANLEFNLVGDFLNLLMLPARRHVAEQQFEQVKLDVANHIFEFAALVRQRYFTLQAALQSVAILREIVSVTEASCKLAEKFYEAGNISELQLSREQALLESARLMLIQHQLAANAEREQFQQLLGLYDQQQWTIPALLTPVPIETPDLQNLQALAIDQRLDLLAAGKELEARASRLGMTRDWRLLAAAEFGISVERDPDGATATGPALSLELPVFDQGQANIATADAHLRQSENRLAALALQIRSEVRETENRMRIAQQMAQRYRQTIIPLHERIVTLSQQHHNYMIIGAFELLNARKEEMQIFQDYLHATRDYWIARSDLERAVGGKLPLSEPASEVILAPNNKPTDPQTHQHGGH